MCRIHNFNIARAGKNWKRLKYVFIELLRVKKSVNIKKGDILEKLKNKFMNKHSEKNHTDGGFKTYWISYTVIERTLFIEAEEDCYEHGMWNVHIGKEVSRE